MEKVQEYTTVIENLVFRSPCVLCLVTLNLIGIALWKWRKFGNDWISPMKIVLGGLFFIVLADPKIKYLNSEYGTFANFIIGMCIGGFAIMFHPILIRAFGKIERIALKWLGNGNGSCGPEHIEKKDEKV